MTFIGPTRTFGDVRPVFALRKPRRVAPFRRWADEDGARRALGADLVLADGGTATIEHLARIALG